MSKKILIVEDETPLADALVKMVTELGYQTIRAKDGQSALEKFQEYQPDLVLLDIILPLKNGFEVLEEIKKKLQSPVPVIILSNLDQTNDISKGKKLGAVDYLVKSNISLRELSVKINNFLPAGSF